MWGQKPKPSQFVDIHWAYIHAEVPLSAQSNFQKDGFFESILFYFYIRLTNKRIKRSPYSFPGSAISVFLLCKIPSERANLIFFSINSLLKHLPIYIMIRLFRQKTTLFFGNPYTTNLFYVSYRTTNVHFGNFISRAVEPFQR